MVNVARIPGWALILCGLLAACFVGVFLASRSPLSAGDQRLLETVISRANALRSASVTDGRNYQRLLDDLNAACLDLDMLEMPEPKAGDFRFAAQGLWLRFGGLLSDFKLNKPESVYDRDRKDLDERLAAFVERYKALRRSWLR